MQQTTSNHRHLGDFIELAIGVVVLVTATWLYVHSQPTISPVLAGLSIAQGVYDID